MPVTSVSALPSPSEIEVAAELVHRFVPPTPQFSWPLLNQRAGCEVWLKHENHTPTGAFKVRGGIVYMDWLRQTQPEAKGVITATRGNHGQSLAFAASHFGFRAVVVVPHGNSREKNAAMRALGAELVEYGDDFHAADHHADDLAREHGLVKLQAFDLLLVRGVATYALELFRAAPPLDAVFVPIGWGSGASGLAAARNALKLKTRIIGAVSASAPSYALSFAAGRIVEKKSTTLIADGVAISQPHPDAFEILRHELDQIIEVTDAEIEDAMRVIFSDTHNVAEGAGAAATAALLKQSNAWKNKRVGVVLSGGNVDSQIYARVIRSGSSPSVATTY
jgi:threonine dehydratase